MTPSLKKRFWKEVAVEPAEGGYAILLDGRAIKTPAKAPLVVPSKSVAGMVAGEWDAQEGEVNPDTMPATRMANSAIDLVAKQFDAVADMLAEYGGSDLICYRAEQPQGLVDRQATAWDPLLDWVGAELNAPLALTQGVLPVDQPEPSCDRLAAQVHRLPPFQLAAFHDLVTLSGSLVIALACVSNQLPPDRAWAASRIDEDWQKEQWGADHEAEQAAERKKSEFLFAHRFFSAVIE